MRKFRFNKLVRDKIVANQEKAGGKADYRVLSDQEYIAALKAKLLEEAAEMDIADKDEMLGELADVQEVIDALLAATGKNKQELAAAQAQKNKKAGAFKSRHFVETVEINDDDPWLEYYLKNSDRYPEVRASLKDKD